MKTDADLDISLILAPLRQVRSAFPKLSRSVDQYRSDWKHTWPSWCFVPAEFAMMLGATGADVDIIDAMCRWQLGKGIYRIDEDVFEALVVAPPKKLPVEVFDRLPEWCVFIPTPTLDGIGFWAHLQWTQTYGKALSILMLAEIGPCRTPISDDGDHPFRAKAIADFGEADHRFR